MEEAASVAVAAVVVADTEIVNPDGARDPTRRRGTTIRYITEPGAISAFFVGRVAALRQNAGGSRGVPHSGEMRLRAARPPMELAILHHGEHLAAVEQYLWLRQWVAGNQ